MTFWMASRSSPFVLLSSCVSVTRTLAGTSCSSGSARPLSRDSAISELTSSIGEGVSSAMHCSFPCAGVVLTTYEKGHFGAPRWRQQAYSQSFGDCRIYKSWDLGRQIGRAHV